MMIIQDQTSSLHAAFRAWNTANVNQQHTHENASKTGANDDGARALPNANSWVQGAVSLFDMRTTDFMALVSSSQESAGNAETDTSPEVAKGHMKSAVQHMIEDAASDPDFAQKQAAFMGEYPDLVLIAEPFPPNGAPAEEWQRFTARNTAAMNTVLQAHEERKAHYEELVSQGVSGTELYAQMLEFNAAQTDYNDQADAISGKDAGTRTQHYADMAAYLRGLMNEET